MNGWRITAGIVLIAHGVGHFLGIMPTFSNLKEGWNTESWILGDSLGPRANDVLATLLWGVCIVGFVLAGLALLEFGVPLGWWKPLAISFGAVSLLTLLLYWNGLPVLFPNKVGALAVDLIAVIGLTAANWPSNDLLGL